MTPDYRERNRADLLNIAKERGISGLSGSSKEDIVQALERHDVDQAKAEESSGDVENLTESPEAKEEESGDLQKENPEEETDVSKVKEEESGDLQTVPDVPDLTTSGSAKSVDAVDLKKEDSEPPRISEPVDHATITTDSASDLEEALIQITPEQLKRIKNASDESLEEKSETLPEPFKTAVLAEISRRSAFEANRRKRESKMECMKVIKGGSRWANGFMTDVSAGAIVSIREGETLKRDGIEVKRCFARMQRGQLGNLQLAEVPA